MPLPPTGVSGGLGGGGKGGAVVAGTAARRWPSSPPGVMGSSGTAKALQLTPVTKLPPFLKLLVNIQMSRVASLANPASAKPVSCALTTADAVSPWVPFASVTGDVADWLLTM